MLTLYIESPWTFSRGITNHNSLFIYVTSRDYLDFLVTLTKTLHDLPHFLVTFKTFAKLFLHDLPDITKQLYATFCFLRFIHTHVCLDHPHSNRGTRYSLEVQRSIISSGWSLDGVIPFGDSSVVILLTSALYNTVSRSLVNNHIYFT